MSDSTRLNRVPTPFMGVVWGTLGVLSSSIGCGGWGKGVEEAHVLSFDWGTVEVSQTNPCEAPVDGVSFTEVGASWGLEAGSELEGQHINGGAIAALDLNGDGALDLLQSFEGGTTWAFLREGDGFEAERRYDRFGPASMTLLDTDLDGQLELLWQGLTVQLLEVGEALEVVFSEDLGGGMILDAAVGDFDGDGWRDALVLRDRSAGSESSSLGRDFVYWSTGANAFEGDFEGLEEQFAGVAGFDSVTLDVDQDGDLDVYIVSHLSDNYGPNVLWLNDGQGNFSNDDGACNCLLEMAAMGVAAEDVDGDGLVDLFISDTFQNRLLLNEGGGQFYDATVVTQANQMEDIEMGWGGHILDYDNDGARDILIAYGDLWYNGQVNEPEYIGDLQSQLLRQEDGVFVDVTQSVGLTGWGSFRSVLPLDYNDDGVQDVVVTDVVERAQLYLSDGCIENNWLEVFGPEGTQVEIEHEGGTSWARLSSDIGFYATKPPSHWFGLGSVGEVDTIRVIWADGGTAELDESVLGRRSIRLIPSGGTDGEL
jgi:hypothetical protein